jgi:hypothetical protein
MIQESLGKVKLIRKILVNVRSRRQEYYCEMLQNLWFFG